MSGPLACPSSGLSCERARPSSNPHAVTGRRDDEPEPVELNAAELEAVREINDYFGRVRARFDEQNRLAVQRDLAAANRELARTMGDIRGLPTVAEQAVDGAGAFLPFKLIERALRMHVRDRYGRRKLAGKIPGLTEWTAGQLLRWYRVGEPNGLWLDADGRVQVGARLAPTRDGVRLPRI